MHLRPPKIKLPSISLYLGLRPPKIALPSYSLYLSLRPPKIALPSFSLYLGLRPPKIALPSLSFYLGLRPPKIALPTVSFYLSLRPPKIPSLSLSFSQETASPPPGWTPPAPGTDFFFLVTMVLLVALGKRKWRRRLLWLLLGALTLVLSILDPMGAAMVGAGVLTAAAGFSALCRRRRERGEPPAPAVPHLGAQG